MELLDMLKIAINSSLKGGMEILKVYSSDFEVEHKQDKSPLTLADKNCNDVIEEELEKTNIPILSEEGSKIEYELRKEWEYFWLVDPLDGTKEFIKRNGEFTVNIALMYKNKPIMGVIYVPVKHELYFGMKDLGSYKKLDFRDKIIDLNKFIMLSDSLPRERKSNDFIMVGSRSHMSKETEDFFENKRRVHDSVKIISVGSSLKMCMVAEGLADVYPRFAPTMEWDTAAGHAIVKYAGFSVINYETDTELIYNKKDLLNPWFIVN